MKNSETRVEMILLRSNKIFTLERVNPSSLRVVVVIATGLTKRHFMSLF